jgi:hypothetical protein
VAGADDNCALAPGRSPTGQILAHGGMFCMPQGITAEPPRTSGNGSCLLGRTDLQVASSSHSAAPSSCEYRLPSAYRAQGQSPILWKFHWQVIEIVGERAGARTRDLLIKRPRESPVIPAQNFQPNRNRGRKYQRYSPHSRLN